MSLSLQTCFRGNVYIVRCSGRITAGQETTTLEASLDMAEREFSSIVLNLSEVHRMDSMGLGLLVRHTDRLKKRGGTICLAAPQPFVAHLLDVTKTADYMPSFSTEEQAIEACLTQPAARQPEPARLRKLLVFDPSADLCMFVHRVLSQHGFVVRTVCSFKDARMLLIADQVDYILVGPGTPQLSAETALGKLGSLAPGATTMQLPADFKSRDAVDAAHNLLQMFGLPTT
ncbi:MAG TPA: STAS domain-containing protein [Acidobacteriaceae bacterium]|nr:STAS domain-containing protein [Acidobacteriaceae bacterium]